MSEILKTEAIVLNKLDYSETSKIVTLFTENYGKISAIVKGAKRPKSKIGLIIDPLNYLQVVIYAKSSRDMQILSDASTISYFPHIKESYEKLKYAFAIIELLKYLTPEHEENKLLFKGVSRILSLIDESSEDDKILFLRFFLFFLKQLGYELQFDKCVVCNKSDFNKNGIIYSLQTGLLCRNCKQGFPEDLQIDAELFNMIHCLKFNKKINNISNNYLDKFIFFLEKYLKYHIHGFGGLKSLHNFV